MSMSRRRDGGRVGIRQKVARQCGWGGMTAGQAREDERRRGELGGWERGVAGGRAGIEAGKIRGGALAGCTLPPQPCLL